MPEPRKTARRGGSEAAGLDDSLGGGWVGRLSSTEIENTG